MDTGKKHKLEKTISTLQNQWGTQAIQTLKQVQSKSFSTHLSTVFSTLDEAVLIGGLPHGRISEITGAPTSGKVTGAILSQLILVRPPDFQQALVILHDFVLGAGIDVIVFDLPYQLAAATSSAHALAKTLDKLIASLGKTGCVLLFLAALPIHPASSLDHYPTHSALPHYASIRLHIQRESWIYQEHDIHGYLAQILVVKNKFGEALDAH